MHVLVTGGAGYIGSIVNEELLRAGHDVVVFDNLSKGHAKAVPQEIPLVRADVSDGLALRKAFDRYGIEAVVHMAADSLVGESMTAPSKYYRNNVSAGLVLLDSMKESGIVRLVFSSTAAVYGQPEKQPIDETAAIRPTNPYGETKVALERAMHWYSKCYGMRYISLRYFNAAGATLHHGESHNPETHLIPLVLLAALGRRDFVEVYGDDYPTRDGTCLRDYVHVTDLARAHVLALAALDDSAEYTGIFNLGCGGQGYSVREVVEAASLVTGKEIAARIARRRHGDPAILVASSEKIREKLGWHPELQDLRIIIQSAWDWLTRHPTGYGS